MDKHITELNGKIFYFSVWAVIALLVIFLFIRYYRKMAKVKCANCGKSLFGARKYRDVYKGMPTTFCGSQCANQYKENGGPLSADQQQVLRAEEAINRSK